MRPLNAITLSLLSTSLAVTIAPAQTLPTTATAIDAPPLAHPAERWVAAWATPQQRVDPSIAPPAPGLSDTTLRQIVRLSVGGKRLRVRLSNDFGKEDLHLAAVHLARPAGGQGAIDSTTDAPLTFAGSTAVTIPAGAALLSDPADVAVPALGDVALTLRLGDVAADAISTHPGARCTTYIVPGDAVAAATLPTAGLRTCEHWFYLAGIEASGGEADAAIVALGDSITDGRNSTTNGNGRWTDSLAARLQASPAMRHLAVINAGIGGNRVLHDERGPSALGRFDRDVLATAGARWLVVLEGVNDLGTAPPAQAADVARSLAAAYQQMIARAHARGLRVYGGTIVPFAGSFYDSPEREAARQSLNRWIRTSGAFDGVADFDATVRDPAAPDRLRADADSGDHLHPNDNGYRLMADAIDLSWFTAADQ